MTPGDMVRLTDVSPEDTRGFGTVLGFDMYNSQRGYPTKFVVDNWHMPAKGKECLAEVLWSDGHIGWVLKKRLKVLIRVQKRAQ